MKRYIGLVFIFLIVFVTACSKQTGHSGMNHNEQEMGHGDTVSKSGQSKTSAEWTINPEKAKANTDTRITIRIQDETGHPINKFDINHEKQMHLIIVNKKLSYFEHIHPEYKGNGIFEISTKFPSGGEYKLFADYVPSGSVATTQSNWVSVEGNEALADSIKPDKDLMKTVGDKEVTLSYDHLMAGKDVNLNFHFVDTKSKQPITDLQPYLGAIGHVVIISEDTNEYLHVHPINETDKGPEAKFMTSFPKSGVYKIWGQFKENDKTFIVPFVVKVP
ncbi:hypothetical protein ACFQZT_18640 [Paenibacillus sp. GCM10027628]|uniref:hypothetical protein n=1 Tax=Paenibacillus sp. GCM10027628 TaxID=3273413 RepID=UPI00363CC267